MPFGSKITFQVLVAHYALDMRFSTLPAQVPTHLSAPYFHLTSVLRRRITAAASSGDKQWRFSKLLGGTICYQPAGILDLVCSTFPHLPYYRFRSNCGNLVPAFGLPCCLRLSSAPSLSSMEQKETVRYCPTLSCLRNSHPTVLLNKSVI